MLHTNDTFHRIGDRLGHLIDTDHFLGRSAFDELRFSYPPTNCTQAIKGYDLEVALPGFRKEEISVSVEQHILKVRAQKPAAADEKPNLVRQEIDMTYQQRDFALPTGIDEGRIEASYQNGLLHIYLPNLEASAAPAHRQVAVQ
ncbi:HSP20 family protein [Catalinimonas alkaloidigena]|uniref:HSP20 family protein n=1 Tax=Catalinimonas alkaloidigena TaxID=1075417 RepID=A0A1G9NZ35_9BACT|nr:Hsp20/alpha crystallin family protein [Catalinimonas alkaloidigena]SDL91846.1 HSP20 family protein [Catalinimonas alkaloidigena]